MFKVWSLAVSSSKQSCLRWLSLFVLAIIALSHPESLAKKKSAGGGGRCGGDKMSSTVYFVPSQAEMCPSDPKVAYGAQLPKPACKKFQDEVKMQGTGILNNGNALRYFDRQSRMGETLPPNCAARGAAGCLTPFFSIAADMRIYPAGSLIFVQELAGRLVKMPPPSNRTIRHPGYFIVQDQGSAIKGAGRFDFFTGAFSPKHEDNAFGYKSAQFGAKQEPAQGNISLTDKNSCDKSFAMIKKGSDDYERGMGLIREALGYDPLSQGRQVRGVASLPNKVRIPKRRPARR